MSAGPPHGLTSPVDIGPQIPRIVLSIVIITFNSERYLAECLESVRSLDKLGIEVLIVDGGSIDSTKEIIEHSPFRFLVAAGTSIPQARNIGLHAATGDYVWFLDSDERLLKVGAVALLENLLKKTPTFVMGSYNLINGHGEYLETKFSRLPHRILDLFETPVGTLGMVCQRRALLELGGFDESLLVSEDRDLWLRVFENHEGNLVDYPIADHRLHESSVTFTRHSHMLLNSMKTSISACRRRAVGLLVAFMVVGFWVSRLTVFQVSFYMSSSPIAALWNDMLRRMIKPTKVR